MAQIPFQRGELTDRVRRFTGLVGPYAGVIDELVSPVLITQDLSRAPFRLTGRRFFATVGQGAPTDDIIVSLCHSSPANPSQRLGVSVIDQLRYDIVGWDGSTPYSVISYIAQRDSPLPGGTVELDLPIPEGAPASGPFLQAPGFCQVTVGPPLGPNLVISQALIQQANTQLPVDLTLHAGCSLYWRFQNLATAGVTGFSWWVSGLWYPGGLTGEA